MEKYYHYVDTKQKSCKRAREVDIDQKEYKCIFKAHYTAIWAVYMEGGGKSSTTKILERGKTLHWAYMQKFRSMWCPNVESSRRNSIWRVPKPRMQFGTPCSLHWR